MAVADASSVLPVCLCLLLMAYRTAGDACVTKQRACSQVVADASNSIGQVMQSIPVDSAMVTQKCSLFEGRLRSCLEEMRGQCPGGRDLDTVMQTLQNNFNSMCGPEITCNLRMQDCIPDVNTTTLIAQAAATNPPNAQFIKNKCSEVMTRYIPCMQKLESDCGSVPSVTAVFTSTSASLDSLCGKSSVCRVQIAKCQAPILDLAATGADRQMDDTCPMFVSAKRCLNTEVDSECRTLPDVQQLLTAVLTNIDSMGCPDADRDMGGQGSGQGQGLCPQVMTCMDEAKLDFRDCSGFSKLFDCISGLRDKCTIDEEKITFSELRVLSDDICQLESSEMNGQSASEQTTVAGGKAVCGPLSTCLQESDLVKNVMSLSMGTNMENLKTLSAFLRRSQTWCRFLEQKTSCHISTADSCDMADDFVKAISTRRDNLKAVCPTSGAAKSMGTQPSLWLWALILITTLYILLNKPSS